MPILDKKKQRNKSSDHFDDGSKLLVLIISLVFSSALEARPVCTVTTEL